MHLGNCIAERRFFFGPGHGAGFYASEPSCISYLLIHWSCALAGRFFWGAICKYIVGIRWHWAWDWEMTIMMIDDGGGGETVILES